MIGVSNSDCIVWMVFKLICSLTDDWDTKLKLWHHSKETKSTYKTTRVNIALFEVPPIADIPFVSNRAERKEMICFNRYCRCRPSSSFSPWLNFGPIFPACPVRYSKDQTQWLVRELRKEFRRQLIPQPQAKREGGWAFPTIDHPFGPNSHVQACKIKS